MIGFNLLTKKSGLNLALHLFVLQSVKWQSCSETMALLIPPNMPCGRSPPFSAPLLCKDNEASGGVFLCPRYFLSVISLSRSAQLSLGATFWVGVCQTQWQEVRRPKWWIFMCLFLVFLLSHDSLRAVLPLKGSHSEQFVLLGCREWGGRWVKVACMTLDRGAHKCFLMAEQNTPVTIQRKRGLGDL